MVKRRVVVFGNEELAMLDHAYLTHDSPYEVAAFAVDRSYVGNGTLLGLPVMAFEGVETEYPPEEYSFSLLAGFRDVNRFRSERYERVKDKGYELISYVSSSAIVSPLATIGEGCHIYEGAVIQPFAKLGKNVVVSPMAMIGHHTIIEDHCFISSRATILGLARVGSHSVIAASATILDSADVASRCIIGAGVVLSKNTKDGEVYVGRPADRWPRTSDQFASMLTWTADVKRHTDER